MDSRFVYPRSIQNDVADGLATARSMVTTADLAVIDLVTRILLDVFFEHDPPFSSHADRWADRARLGQNTPRQSPTSHRGEH
mgnify:CR=1 FL=1